MNLFDILGPVMVGPSSSHTAGAVRIGYTARTLLGSTPISAEIGLHGSFAATGRGHGTDRALVAGLLGMKPDDMRIPESFEIAKNQGMQFLIENVQIAGAHPNTARLRVKDKQGNELEVQASSVGGGRILINKLDGITVNCTGEGTTLIVHNQDHPGHVSEVTTMLAKREINIATLQLYRNKRGGDAVMVIEIDQPVPEEAVRWLEQKPGIMKVTYLNGAEV